MKVQVFQLFFKDGEPTDADLFSLVTKYAEEHMTYKVDFTTYKNTWAACEVDEEGKPVRCLGILSMVFRADFPLCRFTDNAAVVKLVQRANDHLHDLYNQRGGEALICINKDDAPETRCTNYEEWMKS